MVEAGLAPASPAGRGADPRAARREARGELVVQVREPDGMPGGEDDPLPSLAREPEPRGGRRAGIQDGLRTDLDRPGPSLAIDRRAGGVGDEIEHAVERDAVLQPRQTELLVGVVVEEQLRVPADVVQRVGGPSGDEPGEQRAFQLCPRHRPSAPRRPVQRRKSADVGFDNVGGHLSASLGEETRWSFETPWS